MSARAARTPNPARPSPARKRGRRALLPAELYAAGREGRSAELDVFVARTAAACVEAGLWGDEFGVAMRASENPLTEPFRPLPAWVVAALNADTRRFHSMPEADESPLYRPSFFVFELEHGYPTFRAHLQLARFVESSECTLSTVPDGDVLQERIDEWLALAAKDEAAVRSAFALREQFWRRPRPFSDLGGRPRGVVWRVFHKALTTTFTMKDLGEPTLDDLTDLSMYAGIESGTRTQVKKRWRDRLALQGRDAARQPSLSLA